MWTEILENDQNGPLLGYTTLEQEAEVLSVLDVVGADVYQVILTGLLKYTLYSIQLLAHHQKNF